MRNVQRSVTGDCPVTQKKETIQFLALDAATLDEPNLYARGRRCSCSAIGLNKCPHEGTCPIWEKIPVNFKLTK